LRACGRAKRNVIGTGGEEEEEEEEEEEGVRTKEVGGEARR
jgi:hypothetical protein